MFQNTIVISPEDVRFFELVDADSVSIVCNDNKRYYAVMNDESKKVIYDALEIKHKLSKDLYLASADNWHSLISKCQSNENYDIISSKSYYVIDSTDNILVSIISPDDDFTKDDIEEQLHKIDDVLEESAQYYSDCLYKFVVDLDNGGKAVIEISLINSTYKMFTMREYGGILIPMFSTTPTISAESLIDFINADITYEFNLVNSLKDIDNYMTDEVAENVFKNVKLSLREVLNVVKWSKIKVNIGEDEQAEELDGIPFSDSKFLINYFNSFNMAYKSLGKLTDTRKSVKYSGINFVDLQRLIQFLYFSNMLTSVSMKVINYMYDCVELSDAICIKEELKVEV